MKQQLVVAHTIDPADIPALLNSSVTNIPYAKMLRPQKDCLFLHFRENVTCLNVCRLSIGQVFRVFCKLVYRWVKINYCSMNDMFPVQYELGQKWHSIWTWYSINDQQKSPRLQGINLRSTVNLLPRRREILVQVVQNVRNMQKTRSFRVLGKLFSN